MAMERQKTLAIIACMAISGCAVTPDKIKELGSKAKYQFDTDYRTAANCVSRQYDNIFQGLATNVRDGDQDIEIILKSHAASISVLSIKNVSPATADLYVTNSTIGASGWIEYTNQAVTACNGKAI